MLNLILLLTLLFFPNYIYSKEPNNKYGIHLAQPHLDDIKASSDLVNSNGGKWGYVTLVIQENDRDRDKWQGIFNLMREKNLIPIVRLATRPEGENWRRPEPEDAKDWISFLDSLNWVVRNRYIVLFNEPNHGSEWGGEVDEKSYAKVSYAFAKALKEKNKDFFVMLAGFDASAPSWLPGMEDEKKFLEKFFKSEIRNTKFETNLNYQNSNDKKVSSQENCFVFDASCFEFYFDGWASHSYPNPGFSGSPYSGGRGSVKTYEWELGMLGGLGISKNLPVFITETGWKRGNEAGVAENFKTAYEQVWGPDDRIWAVTPFVFDYQGPPFLEFSWKKYQSSDFYQQYYSVQSLTKTKGDPEQIEKGGIDFTLPRDLVAQSKYEFKIILKNQGQAIWDVENNYTLKIADYKLKEENILMPDLKDIQPFEEKTVNFNLKTEGAAGIREVKFQLVKDDRVILESKPWNYQVLPLPDLKLEVNFWPFTKGKGNDFELQLFNIDERPVFKKKGVKVEDGRGLVKDVQNIALDELYRAVVLKPGYLPRQSYVVFKATDNYVKFKRMLPFDKNSDGKLDIADFISIFVKKN